MQAKEILGKVKQLFNDLTAPAIPAAATAPTPAAADATKEYELKIGGKVTIDKLEVGGIVMIDGSPALPGDIELVDGTKVTIGDNGAITSIEQASSTDAPPVMDMGAKFTEFETSANEKFTNYETKFAAYEQRFADYEVKLNKANKVIEELLKLSQLIVDAPAASPDPAIRTSNTFKKDKKEKSLDILFN